MEKFIPIGKRSKREQKKYHAQKRGSWGGINPITRKPPNSHAYQRQNSGTWKRDIQEPFLFDIF